MACKAQGQGKKYRKYRGLALGLQGSRTRKKVYKMQRFGSWPARLKDKEKSIENAERGKQFHCLGDAFPDSMLPFLFWQHFTHSLFLQDDLLLLLLMNGGDTAHGERLKNKWLWWD